MIEHDWRTLEISHCDAARPRFTRIVNGSSRRIGYHVVPTYAYQADSPSKRLSQLHSFVSFFSSTESGANLTGPFIPVSHRALGKARGLSLCPVRTAPSLNDPRPFRGPFGAAVPGGGHGPSGTLTLSGRRRFPNRLFGSQKANGEPWSLWPGGSELSGAGSWRTKSGLIAWG